MNASKPLKRTPFRIALNSLFLVIYVIFCLELFVRVAANFVSIYDVEMIRYAVELKRRSVHPELLHEHIPDSAAKLMGVDVQLNSLGHRSAELPPEKTAEQLRVHVIGSSMTFGWGVVESETYPSRLKESLSTLYPQRKVLLVNGGIGNTNTELYVEQFKLQYKDTRPDIVIMQYFVNDAEVISPKANNPIFRYLISFAFLKQLLDVAIQQASGSGSLSDYYGALYEQGAPGWTSVQDYVRELKELGTKENFDLVILMIPDLHDLSKTGLFSDMYLRVESAFDTMNIPVVNTYGPIAAKYWKRPEDAWVAKDDAHPNGEVHRIIADELSAHFLRTR